MWSIWNGGGLNRISEMFAFFYFLRGEGRRGGDGEDL